MGLIGADIELFCPGAESFGRYTLADRNLVYPYWWWRVLVNGGCHFGAFSSAEKMALFSKVRIKS